MVQAPRSSQRIGVFGELKIVLRTIIRKRWKTVAAAIFFVAALSTIVVNIEIIRGWFHDKSLEKESSGSSSTSPVQIAPRLNEEAKKPADREHYQSSVLMGHSRVEIRRRNGLRSMLDTEDGQVLSRLMGVYGFANHLSLKIRVGHPDHRRLGLQLSTLKLNREQSIAHEVEVHALGDGRVMVLVNVSTDDAARLSAPTGDVGEVLGFFFDGDEARMVMVGIPVSRIQTWQPRTQEFAAIKIN